MKKKSSFNTWVDSGGFNSAVDLCPLFLGEGQRQATHQLHVTLSVDLRHHDRNHPDDPALHVENG